MTNIRQWQGMGHHDIVPIYYKYSTSGLMVNHDQYTRHADGVSIASVPMPSGAGQ